MRRIIYFIIVIMSFALVFPQKKSCCKSKAGKQKIACKLNRANIDGQSELKLATIVSVNNGVQSPKDAKSNLTKQINCGSCTNVKWWKFWSKKKGCSIKS